MSQDATRPHGGPHGSKAADAAPPSGMQVLDEKERHILKRIRSKRPTVEEMKVRLAAQADFGDRLADKVAEFGGSWSFILLFSGMLLGWAAINSLVLIDRAFDPYPYIFLNLLLSMLAALQAPIIMMAQNRQADRDRQAAEHDYEVNLKAEVEIVQLHDKLDEIRTKHLAQLIASQQEQIDLLTRLVQQQGTGGNGRA